MDGVDARVAIAELIRSVLPSEGFASSIGDYVRSDAYKFLIAFPDEGSGETLADAVAVVVFSRYELPMANRAVLGVDALAIRAETLDDALEFLRVLAQIAGRSDLHGVLVAAIHHPLPQRRRLVAGVTELICQALAVRTAGGARSGSRR